MKIFLVTISCLGLMVGASLVIGIMTPRLFGQSDHLADQVMSKLETDQKEHWSEDAKMRWEEVVDAPARNRHNIENGLALFGGFSVLISAGILWRTQRSQIKKQAEQGRYGDAEEAV